MWKLKMAVALLASSAFIMPVQAWTRITFTSDCPEYRCKLGQKPTVTFHIREHDNKPTQGTAFLKVDMDGGKQFLKKEIPLTAALGGKIVAGGVTLNEPGFLRFDVQVKNGAKTLRVGRASFAFEPEKIKAVEPTPKDFMDWWKLQLDAVRKLPLDMKLEKLSQFSDQNYTGYEFCLTLPDGPVRGFLTVPVGKGPFPVLIKVPGAGHGEARPQKGRPGVIQMLFNVHAYNPIQQGKTVRQIYLEAEKAHGRGYSYVGKEDRNRFFFHRVILGLSRCIDYLVSRPDVKPNGIGIYGFSQGGAMTLIGTGLNPKISYAVANMPAMCDLFGVDGGRGAGWPYTLVAYKRVPGTEQTARYYDAVNFAAHIRVPVVVVAGGVDDAARPTGVLAAYNMIPSVRKRLILRNNINHCEGKQYWDAVWKMEAELKKAK